jgi:hypothetical protein
MKMCVLSWNKDSRSVPLHGNCTWHGRRSANLLRPRSIQRCTTRNEEKKGVSLIPTSPTSKTRWQHGCSNGVQLYDEIKARGFTGSAPLLGMFLAELRRKHQEAGSAKGLMLDPALLTLEIPPSLPPKPRITRHMSGTRASWLCVSLPKKLDEKQRKSVEQIRAGHLDLETAYQLGQAFVMMLAERRGGDLNTWLTQAEHSGLASIQKNGEGDSPRLCRGESGVFLRVESGAGRSTGQLLETAKTHRLRQGKFRFTAAACPVPCVISPGAGMELVLWWQREQDRCI